jgi:hypothetical protein
MAAKRSGYLLWLQSRGLAIDTGMWHAAFCGCLRQFGLGGENTGRIPACAALDWTACDDTSAEALAMFAVVVRRLRRNDVAVYACEPGARSISDVLDRSGIRSECSDVQWIGNFSADGRALESFVPAAVWACGDDSSAHRFCDQLGAALRAAGTTKCLRRGVMSTTVELIHNIQSHSGAHFAAAAALLLPRRRPSVLQVGVADDGIGIPDAILSQPLHEWLSWFPDASVMEVVLQHALSGRQSQTGGGMAHHVRRLIGEALCRVDIRSGASHLVLSSDKPTTFTKTHLNAGLGTQVRLEVRLE